MGRTSLLTDHYELTMLEASLRDGTAGRRCVFEVFARRLPPGRRYAVVSGTGRLLDLIEKFRFDQDHLQWLLAAGVIDTQTASWLGSYRFSGNIEGYPEGECYFPYSPILVVEGTFAEAVLLETLVLSVLNHDSAIAAAASRITSAAGGRPCIEMGSRRTHEQAAVAAARAAYIAGFESTSNLAAGHRYGIPTRGTSAHAFSLLHDSETDAFESQVAALGPGTTLLVDTFDVAQGVRNGIAAAGTKLGGVRIDSGDLLVQARQVRRQLDDLDARGTRIVVTSDLDEHAVAALCAAPVDGYGVGTQLVTGCGAPTANLVYKLVAREDASGQMVPVIKRSQQKVSPGGRKRGGRLVTDGVASAEIVAVGERGRPTGEGVRDLMVTFAQHGQMAEPEPLDSARERHRTSLAELPEPARRLSAGEPAIPTEYQKEAS